VSDITESTEHMAQLIDCERRFWYATLFYQFFFFLLEYDITRCYFWRVEPVCSMV